MSLENIMNPKPGSSLKSRKVFSAPELASIISSFCTEKDCARLLRASKVLFRAAVPFVWDYISCAKHLLSLISGTYERPVLNSTHGEITFCVPLTPTDGMFDRFEIYAPHVKDINVNHTFGIVGWQTLLSRARKQFLLPNLRALNIRSLSSGGPDFGLWVMVFSSPTLTSFAMLSCPDSPQPLSHFTASIIMKALVASRPKLERLELFPDRGENYFEDRENPWLSYISHDPFYTYVSHFTTLVTLCCTTDWLIDDSLKILGQLSCLTRLEVSESAHNMTNTPELSPNSFCLLKSVILRDLLPSNIIGFMNIVPLVNGLVSLSIQSEIEEHLLDEDMSLEAWLNVDFLPLLLNAPHLTTFKMRATVMELDIRGLHILQQLPLQVLKFASMTVATEVGISDLASAFPLLTHLTLPYLNAGLANLHLFSALPALQDFRAQLNLQPEPWDRSNLHNSGLLVLTAEHCSVICAKFGDMDVVVRALTEIFPSLTHIDWPTEYIRESQKESIEFFNGMLSDRRKILAFERPTRA